MNGNGSPIQSPMEGETLAQYLQRFKEETLQQLRSNPERWIPVCRILLESFRDLEHMEDGLENLWNVINRVNNFDRLIYSIKQLEPVRRKLLETLNSEEKEVTQMSKLCTVGRVIGSSLDIAGTIGSLSMKHSNPGYANLAFRAATAFGLLGLVSTTTEMNCLRNSLNDLMRLIRKDQELLSPIQRWYQQTNELEEAMQAIFPFDITNQIVAEFADITPNDLTPVKLLAALLRGIMEQDETRLRDERLIRNLINFVLYPASQDWFQWIIFRRHPVILDITRIILQLQQSPLQFTLYHSIPALAFGDQSISAFPVWGRIALNAVSMTNSLISLWRNDRPNVAMEMRHLREHLNSEMEALLRIVEFVRLRRSREGDQSP